MNSYNKMEKEYIDNLIALKLSNQINNTQNIELNEWLIQSDDNLKYFQEVEKIWNISDADNTFNPDVHKAWNELQNRLNLSKDDTKVVSINRPKFKFYRVAAAITVMLGFSLFLYNTFSGPAIIEYTTYANQTKEITLPDNSKVILNANSTLKYPEKFNGSTRSVELQGEAFFDVTKDKEHAFIINTFDAYTKVLGTSFNIKAMSSNDKVTVSVVTGKVEVGIVRSDLKAQLIPGNTAIIDFKNTNIEKVENTIENINAWKTGSLNFDDQLISVLINDLELLFNVNIEANANILNCHFTGSFNKPELFEILNILELSNGITHIKKDGVIYLEGKGCL